MAVPANLAALSTTAASNPPAGSDAVFPLLDDHLRFTYSCLATLRESVAAKISRTGDTTLTGDFQTTNGTWTGAFAFRMANAYMNVDTGNNTVIFNMDANDYLAYYRSTDSFGLSIAGVNRLFVDQFGPGRNDDATTANGLVRKSQMDAAVGALFYAGDFKDSYQTADHGRWLLTTGPIRSIGNAASGATALANADASALFAVLWNAIGNGDAVIQDSAGAASTRGASAAADFAANKRITIPSDAGLVAKGHHGGDGTYTTNTTRALGSYEADQVQYHTHAYNAAINGPGSSAYPGGGNFSGNSVLTSAGTGGPENLVRTRSKNVFIYF